MSDSKIKELLLFVLINTEDFLLVIKAEQTGVKWNLAVTRYCFLFILVEITVSLPKILNSFFEINIFLLIILLKFFEYPSWADSQEKYSSFSSKLKDTLLEGANLNMAKGITPEQLKDAITKAETVLHAPLRKN